jgi:hypothetical protein
MKTLITASAVSLLCVASMGCGRPVDAFTGTYSANGTNSVEALIDGRTFTASQQITGNLQVYEGAASDLILAVNDGCDVPFDVTDWEVAVTRGSPTCTQYLNGFRRITTITSGSFFLRGGLATVNITGEFTEVDLTYGDTFTGSVSSTLQMSHLTKH